MKLKGYKLADECLDSDCIDNISILLGCDNSHILPLEQQNFAVDGKTPSCLFKTPSGYMLTGSSSLYLENLDALPTLENSL